MGVEEIKEAIAKEERRLDEPSGIVRLTELIPSMLEKKRNPDADVGDNMQWNCVDLTLYPEIYLLTGIPSMGKSVWLDNVIVNSIQMHEYKWGVFSPEAYPVEDYLQQVLEIYLRTSFYGRYGTVQPTDAEVEKAITELSDSISILNPHDDDKDIDSMLLRFAWLVENEGRNAFVLDPYNEFSHTRPSGESETEYVSRFLGKVRAFVNQYNVMVWIVAHPTKLRKEDGFAQDGTKRFTHPVPTPYDIAGSANFFNKPDNIVVFHRDKDKETNPDSICKVCVQKVRRKARGNLGDYLLYYDYKDNTFRSADGMGHD